MPPALRSALVLGGLCVLLAGAALWGFRAATEPFPGRTDPAPCRETAVSAGDKVFPDQVTVSVYNASERDGLAGLTLDLFRDEGFNAADSGNAPDSADVAVATIWTDRPDAPDVRLVASRLGKRVEIEDRPSRGPGVTVLVGDGFKRLFRGQKSVVAEQDGTICSPSVG